MTHLAELQPIGFRAACGAVSCSLLWKHTFTTVEEKYKCPVCTLLSLLPVPEGGVTGSPKQRK